MYNNLAFVKKVCRDVVLPKMGGGGVSCGGSTTTKVTLKGIDVQQLEVKRMVVDGAWRRDTWKGVAVWCMLGSDGSVLRNGAKKVFASSALMVEALVVWITLVATREQNWAAVEIHSACLALVQGLKNGWQCSCSS